MISVIITTFNRPVQIVKRALDSVLAQTYPEIEIIIINDCPDNKKLVQQLDSLIDKYKDSRIRYFVNKKNLGACASRNIGIKKSRGEYIAFLDDDDEWFIDKLSHQISKFTEQDIGLVYCKYIEIDTKKKTNKVVPIKDVRKNTIYSLLKENSIGSTSYPLIAKKCFANCGMFNTRLQSCQDWDMWLRIAEKYRIGLSNEILVKYYISEDGITANMSKRLQGWNMMLKLYKHYYDKYPETRIYLMNHISEKLIEKQYYRLGFLYMLRGKFEFAINKFRLIKKRG